MEKSVKKEELAKFFIKDKTAFYKNDSGESKFRGVNGWYGDTVRPDKAVEQSKIPPAPFSEVFAYVNQFVEFIRDNNGYETKNVRSHTIKLDDTFHTILDNGIIAQNLKWVCPKYDEKLGKYVKWDEKYDKIKETFNLEFPSNIVWIKFTKKGHVGVIAKSFDINFKMDNSSGKLIKEVGDEWNDSFVFIFPLTREIIGNYRSTAEIELAIGQYLVEKEIPIIDFYSHNN